MRKIDGSSDLKQGLPDFSKADLRNPFRGKHLGWFEKPNPLIICLPKGLITNKCVWGNADQSAGSSHSLVRIKFTNGIFDPAYRKGVRGDACWYTHEL